MKLYMALFVMLVALGGSVGRGGTFIPTKELLLKTDEKILSRCTIERIRIKYRKHYRKEFTKMKMLRFACPGLKKQITLVKSKGKRQKILFGRDLKKVWVVNMENGPVKKKKAVVQEELSRELLDSILTYEDLPLASNALAYKGRTVYIEEEGGAECYVVNMRPRYKGSAYTRIVMWIGKEDYLTRRIDYYRDNLSTPFRRRINHYSGKGKDFQYEGFQILHLIDGISLEGKVRRIPAEISREEAEKFFSPENLPSVRGRKIFKYKKVSVLQ